MSSAATEASDTIHQLEIVFKESKKSFETASSASQVEALRVEYLGKKGKFSTLLSRMKAFQPDDRKKVGQLANEFRTQLESLIKDRAFALQREELEKSLKEDRLDATAPGQFFLKGSLHPIRIVMDQAIEILKTAGLEPVFGPEIEFEDANFDRLNFKENHAARDMQATFFVDDEGAQSVDWVKNKKLVLRTHTSPVQVRVMLDRFRKDPEALPIRVQAPGRVYRVDDDATHSPMFHQIEGLVVDQKSGMADLYAILEYFCRKLFDDESLKLRFRPSYFPFTEPSAEVDISAKFLKKKANQIEWLEVGGAGLVHPNVFRACGWDPEKVQGWAFGMGVERLAMLKLGIPDLRWFFENRLSFLRSPLDESLRP